MIWLSWRRHRLSLLLIAVLFVALGIWMALVAHWFGILYHLSVEGFKLCGDNVRCEQSFGQRHTVTTDFGTFSLSRQATAIDALLLCVPCLLGVVFGAPLVARELTGHTNRLAWTQTVSRTRWLMAKWLVTGVSLISLVALLTWFEWWWYSRVQFGSAFLHYFWGGVVSPPIFSVSGIVPVAYTAFAFTLGTALGAIIRRSSWAAVGTVVAYIAVGAIVLVGVRPYLAPHDFITGDSGIFGINPRGGILERDLPWTLGTGYRFAPGAHVDTGDSATAVGLRCLAKSPESYGDELAPAQPYDDCLALSRVQVGTLYMPARSYWTLQWRESAIFLALTGGLLALAVRSVRRWRA